MLFNKNSTTLNQKLIKALTMAVALLFIIIGLAAALSLANADGIWSNATGSGGTPTCLHYNNTAPTDDENQVAYGPPAAMGGACPSEADVTIQSGFGFDGKESLTFAPEEVFLLGEFTHYNRTIFATDQPFQQVELTVNLVFDDPAITTNLDFTIQLDETLNAEPCAYPGDTICPDKVDFADIIPDEIINIDGTLYTLQIVGFIPGTEETGCNPDDSSPINQFITEEEQANHACLFGRIKVAVPGIAIDKSVDQDLVPPGTTVNYRYDVSNIGETPLTEIVVSDDKCDPVTPIEVDGFNIGDTDQDSALDRSEIWQFACSSVINQDTTNTATAAGVPPVGDPVVSEPDQETVIVEESTAIDLTSFAVEANDGRVMVLWETGTEIDNAGFNIYRAASPDGPWFKVNPALIAAEGDPVSGASYTFADMPGRGTFYYQLEDVDYFGLSTLYDPVIAELGSPIRAPWFRPIAPEF